MPSDKKITLSEAMQLGAMLRPQTFGPFSDNCGTCAMGAALEAVGQLFLTSQTNEKRIRKIWPWLNWRLTLTECPWCGVSRTFHDMYYLIVHLNDHDRLSRQTIASLLYEIEGQASKQIALLDPTCQQRELHQLEANLDAVRKRKKQRNYFEEHSRNEGQRVSAETSRGCLVGHR